jgi:acetyl esterase/lipase
MSFYKLILGASVITFALISCNQTEQAEHRPEVKEPVPKPEQQASFTKSQPLPVWLAAIPDAELITGDETYNDGIISNVSKPTFTIYSPKGKNTGVAVLVFPGGGYTKLAIEMEGSEICEWLSSIGVTGVLLKYRVPGSGPYHDRKCDCQKDPVKPLALQDAQRTLGWVRLHAKEWNIDPDKIGVMGFSAGGHLVANLSTHYEKRVYPVADEADKESCRPDFAMAFYPGHMLFHTTKDYELNPDIPVDRNTPPTFLLQAGDDPVDTIQNSLVYYIALKKASVPVEYHIYAEGGHAFGYKKTSQPIPDWPKLPIAGWPDLAEKWLHTIKMIPD